MPESNVAPLGHPRLSIIVPLYNARATVAATIQSLQAIETGWEGVNELIVCDDCSTDGSLEVVRESGFDRCRLVLLRHEVNQGEAGCYQTMLEQMSPTSDWFIILHADDLALPNFLMRNQSILSECCTGIASVSSNYYSFNENTRYLASPEEDLIVWGAGMPEGAIDTARTGSWWHISGALVNRKAWEQIGGRSPALPHAGDWEMVLRWQCAGWLLGHSLVPTTQYRQEAGSVSSNAYLSFQDLREQCLVVAAMPGLFSGHLRTVVVARIIRSATRRMVKFAASGNWGRSGKGLGIIKMGGRLMFRCSEESASSVQRRS